MMWVCRAGKLAQYYDEYLNNSIISLPWDGFEKDLSGYRSLSEFRDLVKEEKGDVHRTSISNWASQIYSFCIEMKIGDYVLIPSKHSKTYVLAKIDSDYFFVEQQTKLRHVRKIKILKTDIPKERFPQNVQYSLGAFRTLFKPKSERVILETIEKI